MNKFFKNKELISLIISLLISGILLLVYFTAIVPKDSGGQKKVTLEIYYAKNSYSYDISTDSTTVLDLLEECNEEYELQLKYDTSAWGAFITGLKGVTQNEEKGYYYTYSLNGGYATGISTQTISDGDVITFKYTHTVYDENWNIISDDLVGEGQIDTHSKAIIIIICVSTILLLSSCMWCIVKIINKKKVG